MTLPYLEVVAFPYINNKQDPTLYDVLHVDRRYPLASRLHHVFRPVLQHDVQPAATGRGHKSRHAVWLPSHCHYMRSPSDFAEESRYFMISTRASRPSLNDVYVILSTSKFKRYGKGIFTIFVYFIRKPGVDYTANYPVFM